jgi:hypothetical protein
MIMILNSSDCDIDSVSISFSYNISFSEGEIYFLGFFKSNEFLYIDFIRYI